MVFSDGVDTQVFTFSLEDLKISKLTKKICHENGIKALPAARHLQLYKSEEGHLTCLLLSSDLKAYTLDLASNQLTQRADLLENI